MSTYCKIVLISIMVLSFILFIFRTMVYNMTKEERSNYVLFGKYPTRLYVTAFIFMISVIETIISLIVWIIKA